MTIESSTLSGNTASLGAGIYNDGAGMVTVTNSTVSTNTANSAGGGMFNIGALTILNSTLSGNSGDPAGGVFNIGALDIGGSVLNGGSSGDNITNNNGTVLSHGYNLCSDGGGGFLVVTGDQINTDPLLGPLQNNGGSTFTHELLTDSPAIDAGDPNFTPPPSVDQRGYARVYAGRIDIGSFEVQPIPTPGPITISGTISYCPDPVPGPVPNAVLNLTGSVSGATLSDSSGNYTFTVPFGGSYDVTPNKTALAPGGAGINTLDVVAVQRHFLRIGTPLSGCRLTAGDVTGDAVINTLDVIAIQRFYLVLSTGTANVGNYQFNPAIRFYRGIFVSQPAQDFDALILGDVASPFVE
jgi:hypothetical protein